MNILPVEPKSTDDNNDFQRLFRIINDLQQRQLIHETVINNLHNGYSDLSAEISHIKRNLEFSINFSAYTAQDYEDIENDELDDETEAQN